ncbi:Parasporal protein [Solibacillus isronensis B3W22]|uniref:Parasporal protein n=1 Tax=Solibacillus isronensis B3W22 TaxID=1224748 RepID=K1KWY5_9BACL|nr:S-layer homology domain-containing protein [Solibacillus isronensis]AMO84361.1 Parasporal protein [Solibacillus silvestris]EKB44397.1 Parasporal protein [Solibacillus isronensis B3W22]
MKVHTKFLASATAAVLAATAVVPAASAASFSDIKGSGHENAITSLSEQGIIGGYPDGTFKPNQNLTRSDVVKLLGKYLVSLGHEVPKDYKTKMRFTDLTAKSQDELLQYAALVKDVGVFQGSNGALMHRDQLRRDQMATVLVRAFKVINEFDYVEAMKETDYKSNIGDLNKTTKEHQESIETLAYYAVTKQKTFSPKDSTKRGQFATFLYNMLQIEVPKPEPEKPVLTIKKVEVQAADKLRVTLSDDKAYIVTLKTPLVENVETEVTFDVNEQTFTTKVKFEVPDLKISSITNPNGGQIAISFNQPVKLGTELNTAAINKLVAVTGVDRLGQVQLSKGQLSEDKRTLTVTINATTGLEGRYRVVVDGIESATSKKLIKYDDIATFVPDKTAPGVLKVENISASKVKVIFTEPVTNPIGVTQFKLADGSVVSGIQGTIEKNATEVIYDLSAATAKGQVLAPGTAIAITFGTIIDISNNLSSPNPLTAYVTKGDKDGVIPTLTNVTQLGAKKFKLTFSEEIRTIVPADIKIAQNTYSPGISNVVRDKDDVNSYIVTTNGSLNGYTTISTTPGRYITDVSGEVNVFSTAYNFVADTTIPSVVSTNVVKDKGIEYLEFTFDRNVEAAAFAQVTLTGNYILNGYTYPLDKSLVGQLEKSTTNDRTVRVRLSNLAGSGGTTNAGYTYSVGATFTGVTSEYGQAVNPAYQVNFVRGSDFAQNEEKLSVLSVETSYNARQGTVIDNKTIVVTFSTHVDGNTASNLQNYTLDGLTIQQAVVKHNEPYKVYLTIKEDIAQSRGTNLTISNLRALNSVVTMEPKTELVFLNENIAPQYVYHNITGTDTITLSFNEAVKNALNHSFEVKVGDLAVPISQVYSTTNEQVAIRLAQPLKSNQVVTITQTVTSTVSDFANNKLVLSPIQFTVPTNINY